MKNKKKTSKLIAYIGMLSVALSIFLCPANSITAQAATTPGTNIAEPCSDNIGYRFYTIGKKLYKQLYNYSKGVWVGDPIFLCELP